MGKGGVPCPKRRPSLLDKRDKKRAELAEERRVRAAVKQRDGFVCRVCDYFHGTRQKYSARVIASTRAGCDVHHIVPRSLGGKTVSGNLIYVCRTCHQERHAGVIRIAGNADKEITVERIWK